MGGWVSLIVGLAEGKYGLAFFFFSPECRNRDITCAPAVEAWRPKHLPSLRPPGKTLWFGCFIEGPLTLISLGLLSYTGHIPQERSIQSPACRIKSWLPTFQELIKNEESQGDVSLQ